MPLGVGRVMLRSRLNSSAANRILPTKHLGGIFWGMTIDTMWTSGTKSLK